MCHKNTFNGFVLQNKKTAFFYKQRQNRWIRYETGELQDARIFKDKKKAITMVRMINDDWSEDYLRLKEKLENKNPIDIWDTNDDYIKDYEEFKEMAFVGAPDIKICPFTVKI